ncbi:HEPN domain-containing protein [Kitasatospora sp. NPDC053057]|uniref:ApeA N-terminal domain 1-containing protein n=1 Tax=Kitasatospora sp. NPDC053057 TaxID=3364062 RepID=UPI0037CBC302
MDKFEADGVFWEAGNQERAVPGRIRFDPADGVSLELFGGLTPVEETFTAATPRVMLIHGFAGRKKLTLLGCQSEGLSASMPGIAMETFRASFLFSGEHFETPESITFDEFSVCFDQLAPWVRRGEFQINIETFEPNNFANVSKVGAALTIAPKESVTIGSMELELGSTFSSSGDRLTRASIEQQPYLKLKYAEPRTLDEILVDLKGIQDFITLAVDAPAVPIEINLWREDLVREVAEAQSVRVRVDLSMAQLAERVRLPGHKPEHEILLPFDRIGGLESIGRWIEVSRTHRMVLGALLTVHYATQIYEENRYYNVISAAETLHRIGFPNYVRPSEAYAEYRDAIVRAVEGGLGSDTAEWLGSQIMYSNEPRLRDRLLALAANVGDVFPLLVGNVNHWGSVAVNVRNRLTHHDEDQKLDLRPGDLYFISQSIYVLVMLSLLRACGVEANAFSNIIDVPNIGFLRDNLREIIPRVKKSFYRHRATAKP